MGRRSACTGSGARDFFRRNADQADCWGRSTRHAHAVWPAPSCFVSLAVAARRRRRGSRCPVFVVNPKIARRALEKQRTDEVEYAQLLKDNVPAAPIYSGLDGGMNEVFLGRFPVRVTLAKVLPYASHLPQLPPIPWVDNDGSLTSK